MKRIDGPTPSGGAYSTATGFDAAGLETDDLQAASMVVIHEYDDRDRVVAWTRSGQFVDSRSDVRRGFAVPDSVNEANDPWNSELGKATWDVRRHSDQAPVDTLADLLSTLGWDRLPPEEQRPRLANLMTMPSFAAAPAKLRDQVHALFA